MAKPFLTIETLPDFERRICAIAADATPRFGSLGPAAMFCHMRYMLELSLGEVQERDISNIFLRTVMRVLVFHVFTNWPGGRIKAPTTFTPEPKGSVEEERAQLLAAMRRFVETQRREPERLGLSPLVGMRTLRYWGRIHGIDFAHHFKQYAV